MDTLSSSISSSFTNSIPKSTNLKKHLLPSGSIPTATKPKPQPTKLVSNKTTTAFSSQNHFLPPYIHSSSRPSSPLKENSPNSKSSPSTGYAVALLDAARRHNAVEAVHRDVKRLSRWLRDGRLRRLMEKAGKGEIVKAVVQQGRFEKHLVKLVKLLAEKAKVDLLGQVLSEFGKIYDQLSLTKEQLLLLPCGLKMEEKQMLEIVGKIQSHTGAHKVTVTKLLDPSFV